MINRKLMCLMFLVGMTSSCARPPEDLSLTSEAEVLRSYLQAATCLVLNASPEEKARLVAGMPFVDGHVTPANEDAYLNDSKRMVEIGIQAENSLYEVLPHRCPKSSRRLVFHSKQVNERTQQIFEAHFADLVSIVLAVNVSLPEDLRKFFEMQYAAIGLDESTY